MISHEHGFIFVHIGRTGGSSFERLVGVGVTQDLRTRVTGNTDFPEKHGTFSFFREQYPAEFETFFKFTIIRNPYDRIVSAWHWRSKVVGDFDGSLKDFILATLARSDAWSYRARLGLEGLDFEGSVKKLDFVARFETLGDDIRFICSRVGLDHTKFPHTNETVHRPYWEYYDDETRELFTNEFKIEIDYFGYEFGS
jgi:hypothetical protein